MLTDLTLAFLTAFFLVLIATPSVIKVAKLKHIVDEPGDARKLHRRSIPTIGGILIFAGTILAYCLWFPSKSEWQIGQAPWTYSADGQNITIPAGFWQIGKNQFVATALNEFKYLVACMFILFFLGLKDDIIGVAPTKKLVVHIVVGSILVLMADIRLTEFWGLFELEHKLPYLVSVPLSIFIYIVIVNAINLIDGIDGLAAGTGLIASMTLAFWFYRTGDVPLALLAVGLAGSLLGFLIYNWQPAKIFMGDSGSLIIGVVIYVLIMKMIEYPPDDRSEALMDVSKPVLAMAILAYPLIDTLRVFIIRALSGRSPFSADKNHIHHKLLSLGLKHWQVSATLYVFTLFIILLTFLTPARTPNISFLIVGGTALVLANAIFLIKKKNP